MKGKCCNSKKGRKVKKQSQSSTMQEKNKPYERDSSSDEDDNEMPDVVLNSAMKDDLDALNKQLAHLKEQLRKEEKSKRRKKQEMFIAQKKVKRLLEEAKMNNAEEGLNEEDAPTELNRSTDAQVPGSSSGKGDGDFGDGDIDGSSGRPPNKIARKVYPTFNVVVEPLTKTDDCRASSALDFKSRRLANVPRESVKTAVVSYQKKLQVRK